MCIRDRNYVLAGKLPEPGKIVLSPMLSPLGKLIGDLTVACYDQDFYIIYGSGIAQEMHRRWFESHIHKFSCSYENKSDHYHGISLSGPNSRKVLQKLVEEDISNNNFKFKDTKIMKVAGIHSIVNRLSFTGELGYEIYVDPKNLLTLFKHIEKAGSEFSIKPICSLAQMTLRLEKK